jgi:hypothetical protein
MENVTDKILNGLKITATEAERENAIATRIKNFEKGFKYASGMDATIKSYYNGNQYWVLLTETFNDIRLVGFPPNGIGAFGGDSDNWMWPRHTGDFSMFRIYANKENKPAPYSKENTPYKPQQFFTINASGYKEGDFTMVYGFPGTTMEYISSSQLNQVYSITDPVRIEARTKRLDVWTRHMKNSREVFLKYTSKRAGIANGWKKWQGELRGLTINNVVAKKTDYEKAFQGWAVMNDSITYADNLLANITAKSNAIEDILKTEEYIKEAIFGIELIPQAAVLDRMLQAIKAGYKGQALTDTLQKLAQNAGSFYKNYDAATDKDVFTELMPMFMSKAGKYVPERYTSQYAEQGKNYAKWSDYVFSSIAVSTESIKQFALTATQSDSNRLKSDPAWQLYSSISQLRKQKTTPELSQYNNDMNYLNRLYMNAQMALDKNKEFYPDANLTLRLTYGKVAGIDPDGPAGYSFQTNLDGAIAKDNPDVEEFNVPQKLKQLYKDKNYGKWQSNNSVPIAFIADNHTSGGNSGSPVLNSKGELIGTNFDRIWEGTMSDLYFDPKLCRNISLDVRYTLFIVEKMGDAGWLLNEMKIAR